MSAVLPQITFRKLIHQIKKEFKARSIHLELSTSRINKLESSEFYVNAYYDAESDRDGDCAIEVVIFHKIANDAIFEFDQSSQLIVQVYDAVAHEFRHRVQSEKRNYISSSQKRDYLEDPDELDAYALSIAIELIRNLGKFRSISYLRRASRLAKARPKGLYASPTLFQYYAEVTNQKVLNKLSKKVYLNLLAIDETAIFY